MRDNGLQRPYSGMQLVTWILHPVLVVQFVIFCRPLFPLYVWIPLTSVFGILAIASVTFAYITSKINPMDDRLFPQLLGCPSPRKSSNDISSSTNAKDKTKNRISAHPDHTKYCWVCEAHVHIFSMHCKFCDKCVGKFDHHCLWLNTCVGSANYIYFFRTVWVTLLLSLVHFASLVFVVVLYFINYWGFKQRAKEWFDLNQPAVVIGVNIAFLPITLGAIILLVQLWTFHLGIQWEGITTYQYIVRFNARKRDHTRIEAEINNKRVSAIQRAIFDGHSMLACRLRMGPLCRPCDPIRKSVMSDYDHQILHPHGSHGGEGGNSQDDHEEEDNDMDGDKLNKAEKGVATTTTTTRESRYDKHSRNGEKDSSSPDSGTLSGGQKNDKGPSQTNSKHQRKNSNRPYDERDEISLEENKEPTPSTPENTVTPTGRTLVENATIISYSDQSGVEVSADVSNGEDRDVKVNMSKGSWNNNHGETRVDVDDSVPRTIAFFNAVTVETVHEDKSMMIDNEDMNDRLEKVNLAIPTLEPRSPRSVSSTPAKIESSPNNDQQDLSSRPQSENSSRNHASIPHVIKIPSSNHTHLKEMHPGTEISPKTVIQDIFFQAHPPRRLYSHQSV